MNKLFNIYAPFLMVQVLNIQVSDDRKRDQRTLAFTIASSRLTNDKIYKVEFKVFRENLTEIIKINHHNGKIEIISTPSHENIYGKAWGLAVDEGKTRWYICCSKEMKQFCKQI
jgi:hypothetical protein